MEQTLTKSEYAIASLVAEGRTNKQVADALQLSTRAVESCIHNNIFPKLGITKRYQLPMIFTQNPPLCVNRVSGWKYRKEFSKINERMTGKQVATLIGCSQSTGCKYLKSRNLLRGRRVHEVTYKKETRTLAEWAILLAIPRVTLWERIFVRGWDVEKAFTEPVNKKYWRKERRGI